MLTSSVSVKRGASRSHEANENANRKMQSGAGGLIKIIASSVIAARGKAKQF